MLKRRQSSAARQNLADSIRAYSTGDSTCLCLSVRTVKMSHFVRVSQRRQNWLTKPPLW